MSGKVKVGELRSEGTIAGELDADSVHLAGTVKSDTIIRARSLEVRLQPPSGRMQVTFGQCELAVGDVPTKEEAVAAASARPATAARGAPVEERDPGARRRARPDRGRHQRQRCGPRQGAPRERPDRGVIGGRNRHGNGAPGSALLDPVLPAVVRRGNLLVFYPPVTLWSNRRVAMLRGDWVGAERKEAGRKLIAFLRSRRVRSVRNLMTMWRRVVEAR